MRGSKLTAAAALVGAALATAAPAAALPTCEPAPTATTILTDQGRLESIVADHRGRLFYTDLTKDRLLRVDAPGQPPKAIVEGVPRPGGLVFDADGTLIMGFNDRTASGVPGNANAGLTRVDPETGANQKFVTGLDQANGVVRDPSGTLYASSNIAGEIARIAPDGKVERNWAQVESANGLALDPAGRHLFVAQTFTPAKIARVELTRPEAPENHFSAPPEDTAAGLDGLTRDAAGRLYVAANGAGEVWRVDPDGGKACALARGLRLPSAVGFGGGAPGFPSDNLYVVTFGGLVVELAKATDAPNPPPAMPPRAQRTPQLHLAVTPLRPRAGRRTTLRLSTTSRRLPVPGARIKIRGRTATTGANGKARLRIRFRRPGRARVSASRASYRPDTDTIRIRKPPVNR